VMKLKNTLRYLRGEEMITHLGLEYYDWGISAWQELRCSPEMTR
jgi:hypothetical protein